MITQLDHIGIAVKSITDSMPFYKDVLKLKFAGTEEIPQQKVRIAMFQIGDVKIELLEPMVPESPIAQFIEKRGEGIHHFACRTDHIDNTIAELMQSGIEMIDRTPHQGSHGSKIAFIHPKSSKVLIELCEKQGE